MNEELEINNPADTHFILWSYLALITLVIIGAFFSLEDGRINGIAIMTAMGFLAVITQYYKQYYGSLDL